MTFSLAVIVGKYPLFSSPLLKMEKNFIHKYALLKRFYDTRTGSSGEMKAGVRGGFFVSL